MNIRHINPSQILNPIETSRSGQSRQTSTPAEFPEELSQALQKGSTVQSPVSEASAGTTQTTTLTPLQLLFGETRRVRTRRWIRRRCPVRRRAHRRAR